MEGEELLIHSRMYLLASSLLSARLKIFPEIQTQQKKKIFTKAIWLCLSNPIDTMTLVRPFPSHWRAVLCRGCWERGHQEATNRSVPLALHSLFPVITQEALQVSLSVHVEWICRSGVHKANFHF